MATLRSKEFSCSIPDVSFASKGKTRVVIAIDGTEDVLMVPTDAIHKTRDSSFVYTSYDTETGLFGDPKNVLTGVSNKDFTEIRSGLEEGETVCYMETEDPFMAMMGGWE